MTGHDMQMARQPLGRCNGPATRPTDQVYNFVWVHRARIYGGKNVSRPMRQCFNESSLNNGTLMRG